jgi:hypothetical protein
MSPAEREALTTKLRDRVLLYVNGMDVPPILALELALTALRRAEAGTEPLSAPVVMRELHALLKENQLHTGWVDRQGPPRGSMPPLNRCSMVPEPLEFLRLRRRRRTPAGG